MIFINLSELFIDATRMQASDSRLEHLSYLLDQLTVGDPTAFQYVVGRSYTQYYYLSLTLNLIYFGR